MSPYVMHAHLKLLQSLRRLFLYKMNDKKTTTADKQSIIVHSHTVLHQQMVSSTTLRALAITILESGAEHAEIFASSHLIKTNINNFLPRSTITSNASTTDSRPGEWCRTTPCYLDKTMPPTSYGDRHGNLHSAVVQPL